MIGSRTKLWIVLGVLGASAFFRAELLRAEESDFPGDNSPAFLAPGGRTPGTVGNLAGLHYFAPAVTDHASVGPVVSLIEQHLRLEREGRERELVFQELDTIQRSAEFEFAQTDRLLTIVPVEDPRPSTWLLAGGSRETTMGTGSKTRCVSSSRNSPWIHAGSARMADRPLEHSKDPQAARAEVPRSHTDYFSIRNGYIRRARHANRSACLRIPTRSFFFVSISDFQFRFPEPVETYGANFHSRTEFLGPALRQTYDQVPA